MEDVIAVAVRLEDGAERFFVTWGRIQDAVDHVPVATLVLRHARSGWDLGGTAIGARVCWSLAEARDAPYFYEALVHFGSLSVPYGDAYEDWRARIAQEMEKGEHLYYLGRRSGPSDPELDVLRSQPSPND
jgi:hypothetical protein